MKRLVKVVAVPVGGLTVIKLSEETSWELCGPGADSPLTEEEVAAFEEATLKKLPIVVAIDCPPDYYTGVLCDFEYWSENDCGFSGAICRANANSISILAFRFVKNRSGWRVKTTWGDVPSSD